MSRLEVSEHEGRLYSQQATIGIVIVNRKAGKQKSKQTTKQPTKELKTNKQHQHGEHS